MNIDKIAFTPDIAPTDWVPSNAHRTKNPCPRTLARWRAKARAKWPTYQPDVAYAIEGVPQPKTRHGRTWQEFSRAAVWAGIIPGLPPLDHECLRPEHAIPVVDVDTILKEFENDLLRTDSCNDPACGRCTIDARFPGRREWERWRRATAAAIDRLV